ncbi:hypothetical protein [Bacillus nitratireducens]|uniref:hypothetical protein n=1 Tax=Bacillus nitratireducens TaxID=2026193 RepID=UPI0003302D21|nr:hypothetical protein [Bacillus nitratireducens]EOP56369.1 hypothetical protein IKQ_01586 [Bacillus cereus VDM053]PEB82405.1 hypothetical protein COM95_07980 [Bacillus cereus]OJD52300.1 hypothetical protein BAU23_09860 [Bacillus nitratireducens]PFH78879.1 hypothetical protein COI61_10815 [Bacillus cereus]SEA08109.1 hypothetical protein SAMN04488146_1011138 [Bacillus nitratireducens]
MFKQGRILMCIFTVVLFFSSFFFPQPMGKRVLTAIVALIIGGVGIGISYLLENFSSNSKNISK